MSSLGFLQLLAAICTTLFPYCHSSAPNEVSALMNFKESIQEDPFSVLSDWNAVDADPCSWSGIQCSPTRDHVVALNLSSLALKGFVGRELGFLTSLQELVLHNNSFIGPIPGEIGTLKSLTVLDLGMNRLSGPIPRELGNLTNVIKLNLQSNGLTGSIPTELGYLTNLQELRLGKNRLQGTIPGSSNSINFTTDMHGMYVPQKNVTGFCQLSHLRVADFSDNFFDGIIPSCLKSLARSSFQGNCFQDRDPKLQPNKQCGGAAVMKSHPGSKQEKRHAEDAHSARHGSSRPAWLLALEIITGTIVGLLLFVAILTAAKRFKTKPAVIIPWKKTTNGKDHMEVSIG
eukprot:TRINITY_DN2944_c2_g1_i4.p1 TRINITY_DN2944_c2_g1~~TRINITY_DN2944_c2_g1_i4.p1  ORF type:complete len:345 (-),score=59.92 TRINITY_DN2944_c2_g1_i4:3014-4048(-)